VQESGGNTEYNKSAFMHIWRVYGVSMNSPTSPGAVKEAHFQGKSETKGASYRSVRNTSIKKRLPARGLGPIYSASQRPTHGQVEVGLTATQPTHESTSATVELYLLHIGNSGILSCPSPWGQKRGIPEGLPRSYGTRSPTIIASQLFFAPGQAPRMASLLLGYWYS
jgi:hypothetical protein